MLEIGSKFGDYTVIELLGKGAMGEVYRISNGSTDYALKIMTAKSDDAQKVHEWRKRFAREAEVAMKVRHKNLIEVYDIGEDPETHLCYILMEYVGGGTLTGRLKAKGKLEIREAVTITMHIANALSAAHSIGIVHRDIKPDNIMFTTDGVPKLADLGIARWTGFDGETTVTKTEMIIGTPVYMSPEQMLNSHNVDARADIYSLGIVFYEMLTGLRPNQGSTIVELMAKAIKGEEMPDVRELRPEVSAALAYALSRMVAQKAEMRPQSAAEVARLVYDAAAGKILVKKPKAVNGERGTGNGERQRWRLPLILGAAGAALAAALAASLALVFARTQRPSEATRYNEVVVTNVVQYTQERHPTAPQRAQLPPSDIPGTADYVQHGLVAMFDGIENAGRGLHDANAKVWKNLAGNVDAVPMDGEARWSGNAALFDGFSYYKVPSIFDSLQTVTIEVCHKANSPRADRGGALFSSCENGGVGIQKSEGGRWIMAVARPRGWYYELFPGVTGEAETLSEAVGDTLVGYRNAVEIGRVENLNGIRYNTRYNYFQIGRDPGQSDCINGEIYSIRLYSRALNAEEVARNHEIDMRRFNLPKPGIAGLYKLEDGVGAAQANGYTWFYRNDRGHAVLSRMMVGMEEMPCMFPRPRGKVEVPAELDGRRVAAIGERAFAHCDQMTEIVLPEGLKEIRGNSAFYRCNALKEVKLPDSLEHIGQWAFDECEGLKRVDVGRLAVYRRCGSFGCQFIGCPNIERFDIDRDNPKYTEVGGAIYTKDLTELAVYPKAIDKIVLPGSVKTLGWCSVTTFRHRHVVVPEGVETIKAWAFEKSQGMEVIELPKSLKRIGRSQFKWNTALKKVVFHGDAPALMDKAGPFAETKADFVVEVRRGSKGWNGPGSTDLPERWPVGAGNDSRPIRYIGDTKESLGSAPPAGTDMAKTIEIFPRLDRNKKAWAYSFEHHDGWERPDFDDRKWESAPGGFGCREYQAEVRWAYVNTEWKTRNIYLRRHFNWNGGAVSRAVLEFFIDDNINVYLNGRPIYYKHGNWMYWEMGEIDPRIFNNALKKGDNVLCVEAENNCAASYVDCGLRVETGGVIKERLRDGVRKVQTAAGTWTLLIRNGLVSLGDGRDKALDPEPMGELQIPAELDGLRIVDLNQNCFRGCGLLKKVTVPEGVRSIRQYAFQNCHALEAISLPDSLEWIVYKAFYQTRLKRLNIKNTRLLCSEALDQCALEEITANPGNPIYFVKDGILYDRVRRSLVKCPVSRTDVVLPKGIESICSEAFQWCKIKSAVIPQSVRLIEPAAFHTCENLESVEFKCDDVLINGGAFMDCTCLRKVILPKKMKLLDDWAIFQGCRSLEEIVIPDSVERVSDAVFYGCHGLKRVKIGKRVAFMGPRVFHDCSSLETITIPDSVKTMRERMFLNCKSLKAVCFEGNKPDVVEERIFEGTPENLVVYVRKGAKGWTDASGNLPDKWPVGDPDARPIRYAK